MDARRTLLAALLCLAAASWACSSAVAPCEPSDEVCDGTDNDCDGQTDEDLTRACTTACGAGSETCSGGAWAGCDAPQPEEEDCNRVDDDCDGLTDEDLTRVCETACGAGTETCEQGAWAGCDAPLPEDETCNDIDDDCDGVTDEELTRACTSICGAGTETCMHGAWVDCDAPLPEDETCNHLDDDCDGATDEDLTACGCTGGNPPADEECNAVDDDCDGEVDEELTRTCSTACGAGTETCSDGTWVGCDAPLPADEECDGVDNDCDGAIDEELVRACATACGAGTETCSGGAWIDCDAPRPESETCDDVDDDCDGLTDEDLERTCSTVCGEGTEICDHGAWVGCDAPQPGPETCNNHDDDCNGQVDDGLDACQCTGGTPPGQEVCDGVDNDCNGQVDEDDGAGNACGGFGDPCASYARCSSQICVGDVFERLCSAECDPADPASCPDGYRCFAGPNLDYCLKNYPDCAWDGDCLPDMVCTVVVADDALEALTRCRPPLAGGGAPGDDCASSICRNNLCTWPDFCTEVCQQPAQCLNQYLGEATTCILRGIWLQPGQCARDAQCPAGYTCDGGTCRGPACADDSECQAGYACDPTDAVCLPQSFYDYVGECMIACISDADCPAPLVCQAGVLSDGSVIQGFCYNSYGGNPTGDSCDPGCTHGICFHGSGGSDYCTQLCGDATDCPAGMDCTSGTLYMGELGSFPGTYTCTYP